MTAAADTLKPGRRPRVAPKARGPRLEPRLLRLVDAAHYCSLSPQTFLRKCPVAAVDLGDKIRRWDRARLDRWINDLAGDAPDTQSDEEWLAGLDSDESPGRAGAGKRAPQER